MGTHRVPGCERGTRCVPYGGVCLMTLAAPDWLTKRDAKLRHGPGGRGVFVAFAGSPQYCLDVRPAGGTFTCEVTQAVNGRRVGDGTTYPTAADALAGGLNQLREKLGW